jgi:hypothetical protein
MLAITRVGSPTVMYQHRGGRASNRLLDEPQQFGISSIEGTSFSVELIHQLACYENPYIYIH